MYFTRCPQTRLSAPPAEGFRLSPGPPWYVSPAVSRTSRYRSRSEGEWTRCPPDMPGTVCRSCPGPRGLYMLVYLGFICGENMQIEGFWYYLFTGVFEAATIHYAVAKIFGPLFFGRGWCGYACWTAMVLDFLPYKISETPGKKIGWIRYITFTISLIFVSALFLAHVGNMEEIMFWAFIIGNIIYYAVGITLALVFKDNRAFCKYICPVTIFLKPMSYFSLLRIKCDKSKCISCGKCKSVCPMEVDVTDNSRKRKNGTECILCFECVKNCPKDAL